MIKHIDDAVKRANRIVSEYGTRDADRLARELDIEVLEYPFKRQMGAYKVIERNRFIFLKNDLHPVMRSIVLLHEIGHDTLHRKEAVKAGGFKEFKVFDMRNRRMEYEANIFAAEIMLPTDEVLEFIYEGCDVAHIAGAMNSDINLVALKVSELNRQGYGLREQEFDTKFLK